jgi:molybdopterin-guanine dinucleotide biosynthesis protein A
VDVCGAILAGGRAKRLGGANKALMRVGGLRIVDRLIAALEPVARDIFIVAPDAEPYAGLGLRVVPDAIAGAGALGGIYTAIVESPHPRTIVVACDMPFVTTTLFRRLVAIDGADLVMPRSTRGLEPLCAVYGKACAAPIRARIARGDLQASVPLAGVRIAEVGPAELAAFDKDGLLFENVNTPHDYERATGLIELKPDPTQDRITE